MLAVQRRVDLIGLCLVLTLVLAGCKPGDGGSADAPEVVPVIPVEAVRVLRGTIEAAYRGTATLEAENEATVLAKQAGVIEQVLVEEGDSVREGQLLAQLETDRLRYEMARTRADMERLEQDFIRNKSVYQRNLVSREAYERAQFEWQAAQAAFDLARLAVDEAQIRAPFSGVISLRHIKRGNQVQQGAEAFRITQLDRLRASIHVPERDIHKLKPDHPVTLTTDSLPDQLFRGRVGLISPVVDASSGTVKVTVWIDAQQVALRPGMFVRAEIVYDRREQVLLVPRDAVLIEDAGKAVYVVVDGKAQRRQLRLGHADAQFSEVIEGLADGELVVVTGQANLRDDASLSIVNAAELGLAPTAPAPADAAAAERS